MYIEPLRVLLIDDQSAFTRLLSLTLKRSGGYIVREVNDSTKAVSVAREFQPNIIFCDIDMPGIDGGEVASQIRSDPDLAGVPIIFLSSLVGSKESARTIGGFPCLSKPVSIETLVRCIATHALRRPSQDRHLARAHASV